MSIIWIVIISFVGVLALSLGALLRWSWWQRGILAIVLTAAAILSFGVLTRPSTMGPSTYSFLRESPARELILFVIMLSGMMARMLNLVIERSGLAAGDSAEHFQSIKINKWEFVLPTLFAVPTFCTLMGQTTSESLNWVEMALAFQNGFFWQTLLKREQ